MTHYAKTLVLLLCGMLIFSACTTTTQTPTLTPIPSSTPVVPAPSNTIRIVFDVTYPPYMYAENDQGASQAMGLYPTLIEAVFQRMGMQVEMISLPWKRALEMGEKGEAAVAGIYKNEQRLLIYDYSEPIYTEHLYIYVKKGASFSYETPEDLKGKTVGVIRGWSYGDLFDKAREAGSFSVEENVSNIANFEKLLLGRLDCIIVDELAAKQILQQQGYEGQVEQLPTPVTTNDTFLVFVKPSQQTELLKQFNETLAAMRQDGSYDGLVKDFETLK